jgi:indole-3-glycerol phosphate synthase
MNILDRIIATKRQEVAAATQNRPFEAIEAEARAVVRPVRSFSEALRSSESGIIAEFKRRSPSKGFFQAEADVRTIVAGYADNGASAISVLTDRDYFAGTLDDLRQAREMTDKPLLRKDFVIDPYQIAEARIAGADAILLIAAALTPESVRELARYAHSLELEVLLEIHNEEELGHIDEQVDVVGINNRNLADFVTDTAVSERLAASIPDRFVKISESGISSPETVRRLRKAGFRGFLMGENFMKTADPAEALREFIQELKP